jgi:DNA repair protein RadA/Sms
MAKVSTQFVCQACGATTPRWLGRCSACGGWNTLVEEVAERASGKGAARTRIGRGDAPGEDGKPVAIGSVRDDAAARLPTGIAELDRVLGGGAVLGSTVLVGGDPGVGKSTLLLQALAGIAARGPSVLYASGEESVAQVALRARRLGLLDGDAGERVAKRLQIVGASDVAQVEDAARASKPVALVIDSVQVLRSSELESAAGSVSQLREVTARLVDLARRLEATVLLVGHVTKEGVIAGPKVLEHLVDVVLSFEGERGHAFRALRASKNRFGSATEVGVFEMAQTGLREVPNPSELFLAERPAHASGSVIAAVTPQSGGSRAVLVEVQALVGVGGGPGRRVATGVEGARLAMILAVLERKVGVQLAGADVFANVAGGLSIDEPALDLPLALAIASAVWNRPCARDLVAFGEVGLAGEVRGIARAGTRLAEAASMGFTRALLPASTAARVTDAERAGLELIPVKSVEEAIERALPR